MLTIPAARPEAPALCFDGRAGRRGWAHPIERAAALSCLVHRELFARSAGPQAATTSVEVHRIAPLDAVADLLAHLRSSHPSPRSVAPDVRALAVRVLRRDRSHPAARRRKREQQQHAHHKHLTVAAASTAAAGGAQAVGAVPESTSYTMYVPSIRVSMQQPARVQGLHFSYFPLPGL